MKLFIAIFVGVILAAIGVSFMVSSAIFGAVLKLAISGLILGFSGGIITFFILKFKKK